MNGDSVTLVERTRHDLTTNLHLLHNHVNMEISPIPIFSQGADQEYFLPLAQDGSLRPSVQRLSLSNALRGKLSPEGKTLG